MKQKKETKEKQKKKKYRYKTAIFSERFKSYLKGKKAQERILALNYIYSPKIITSTYR